MFDHEIQYIRSNGNSFAGLCIPGIIGACL
jgi:hypothetical protein